MNFGKDNYTLTTAKSIQEVADILMFNTYPKVSMMRMMTMKKFIGEVSSDGFKFIGSTRRGIVCIAEGQFREIGDETMIEVTTFTRKAFLRLYWIWMAVVFIISQIVPIVLYHLSPTLGGVFSLSLAAIIFRLYLHFLYLLGRNKILQILKELLEADYGINRF